MPYSMERIDSDYINKIYTEHEIIQKDEVWDLSFLFDNYDWYGPVNFTLDYLGTLELWVDFKEDSLTGLLSDNFQNRTAANMSYNFLKHREQIREQHTDFYLHINYMSDFIVNGGDIPPIFILLNSNHQKNGNLVDGMHRILSSLLLQDKGIVSADFTLKGYLGL
jgi:hypothetical protein